MDRDDLQIFVRQAETALAGVRGCLLIVAQTGDVSHMAATRNTFGAIKAGADVYELRALRLLAERCEAEMVSLETTRSTGKANSALDMIAEMEAVLWAMSEEPNGFDFDVVGFVDTSIANLIGACREDPDQLSEEFDVDEETLEIFRAEADELLTNIVGGLRALVLSPDDHTALWDIRRNAHTFKGAAGIVGLAGACRIAHRMEDLLDKLVETRGAAAPEVIAFLENSTRSLATVVAAQADQNATCLEAGYEKALNTLLRATSDTNGNGLYPVAAETVHIPVAGPDFSRPDAARPIVRVSLDRLDTIGGLANRLAANRNDMLARFAEIDPGLIACSRPLGAIEQLLAQAKSLTEEIEKKLRGIRMVRFSTLETRLNRAVNVTCLDENKKADVLIENGDIEIDTQMMDGLIEPLLHLLKNAVVHGIEPPDTRRLIGKPERGKIAIRLKENEGEYALSISDDGCGIAFSKLIAEATAKGMIDYDGTSRLDEAAALELIFLRGLTTAAKLDMNAGRGVGMSIVKESIESSGGWVQVESQPHRGTTFTLHLPLTNCRAEKDDLTPVSDTAEFSPLVLIVDDSTSIRHRISRLVLEAGFCAIAAENGAEALELMLSGEFVPDLILSDVEMPQIDGWELLTYLKTDENLGHIPVIMVTSLDSDEHCQRALDLGAAGYIVKPFDAEHLTRVLAGIGTALPGR